MKNRRWGVRRWEALDKAWASVVLGGVAVMGVAAMVLVSARAMAVDSGAVPASVTVASSCELGQHVDTAHEAEVVASTYRDNIGKTTFTVACNDANGYDVYAVGYTNTEFGRNEMLGANTGWVIETGTAESGDTSNWAMKLTSVTGEVAPTITTGYDDYHAIPDDYTKVAGFNSSTVGHGVGSQFETTYAAYVQSLQPADTYVGKVKFTLVHPSDASSAPCTGTYTIAYNANGGSGSMDAQTACVDRQITLLPSGLSPASDDWQFAAWNTAADGSGYTYYPGQKVSNLTTTGGVATLYAVWAPHYIQDLTRQTCSIVANERKLVVKDRRDGNEYDVRYLQDACWMVQNLRITGTVNAQYSNFSTYGNVDVCEGDLTAGNTYDQPRCHDSGNTTNGVWYNYAAASAKTILTSNNTNEATEDICPAGWHLPNRDTTGPAGSIDSLTSMDSIGIAAFQHITGGHYYNGSISSSNRGNWWSATTGDTVYRRYFLAYNTASLYTVSSGRDNGYYVRCVR